MKNRNKVIHGGGHGLVSLFEDFHEINLFQAADYDTKTTVICRFERVPTPSATNNRTPPARPQAGAVTLKSPAIKRFSTGLHCTFVTSCSVAKMPDRAALFIGTETAVAGGANLSVATATSCLYRNLATVIVHSFLKKVERQFSF